MTDGVEPARSALRKGGSGAFLGTKDGDAGALIAPKIGTNINHPAKALLFIQLTHVIHKLPLPHLEALELRGNNVVRPENSDVERWIRVGPDNCRP